MSSSPANSSMESTPPFDALAPSIPDPPVIGMTFNSMDEAKKYIVAWCTREKLPYSVFKADRRAWILTCKDKNNCSFRLRVKNTDSPAISVLSPHTCSPLSFKKTAAASGPIQARPYNWPHDKSFQPSTTALLMIDMQQDFCSPGGYLESQGFDISPIRAIIPGLRRLLSAFRGAGFPIYHTREGHRPDLSDLSSREAYRSRNNPAGTGIGYPGPMGRFLVRGERGHDIIPQLYPVPGEPIIDKPGRGAFTYTDFELLLKIKGIKNLVLAGVTTDVCVSSTLREASDRGYDCLLVEDATAASKTDLHKAVAESAVLEGGIFGATCMIEDLVPHMESLAEKRRNNRDVV